MRLVFATLNRRDSDNGLIEVEDHVPIGKVYEIDVDTIRKVQAFNIEHQIDHSMIVVTEAKTQLWLPVALLDWETKAVDLVRAGLNS